MHYFTIQLWEDQVDWNAFQEEFFLITSSIDKYTSKCTDEKSIERFINDVDYVGNYYTYLNMFWLALFNKTKFTFSLDHKRGRNTGGDFYVATKGGTMHIVRSYVNSQGKENRQHTWVFEKEKEKDYKFWRSQIQEWLDNNTNLNESALFQITLTEGQTCWDAFKFDGFEAPPSLVDTEEEEDEVVLNIIRNEVQANLNQLTGINMSVLSAIQGKCCNLGRTKDIKDLFVAYKDGIVLIICQYSDDNIEYHWLFNNEEDYNNYNTEVQAALQHGISD